MLSQKDGEEIKKMEEAGLDVVVIGSNGERKYSSKSANSEKYCDGCTSLRFLPDPDPHDFFRDGDMKAACIELNAVIAFGLEPRDLVAINKPLYCPKLGRELNNEEKKIASVMLQHAKERMDGRHA